MFRVLRWQGDERYVRKKIVKPRKVHKSINGALILLILELGIEFDAELVLEDFCLAVQITNAD